MKKALILLATVLITAAILTACTGKPAGTPDTVETTTFLQEIETKAAEENITENIVTETPTEKAVDAEPVVTETKPVESIQKTETVKTSNPVKPNANNVDNIITKEEAKAAAIKHAGLKATDVKRIEIELDRERNGLVYEIDFDAGKYEYEYEVDAVTGKVIKSEKEFRD